MNKLSFKTSDHRLQKYGCSKISLNSFKLVVGDIILDPKQTLKYLKHNFTKSPRMPLKVLSGPMKRNISDLIVNYHTLKQTIQEPDAEFKANLLERLTSKNNFTEFLISDNALFVGNTPDGNWFSFIPFDNRHNSFKFLEELKLDLPNGKYSIIDSICINDLNRIIRFEISVIEVKNTKIIVWS